MAAGPRVCVHSEPPARWLTGHRRILPQSGLALDVASGHGRHAFWLAEHGLVVKAVDRDRDAVDAVNAEARRRALRVEASIIDLETARPDLGGALFDLVVVIRYLHRPLFPYLIDAIRPGGLLIYETFTRAQAARGRPSNPAFLLEAGELPRLCAALHVLDFREGDDDEGRAVASIIARRPDPAASPSGGLLH